MTRRIHLVRHAMPQVRAEQPPGAWSLGVDGREAAARLLGTLPTDAIVLSSTEPKAIQTAQLATGRTPVTDERFGEVRRPREPIAADFRRVRRAWVEGLPDERHTGWETRADAAARFATAVDDWPDQALIIGTHGMVLTAWLTSIGWIHAADTGAWWAALALPQVVTVELPERVR